MGKKYLTVYLGLLIIFGFLLVVTADYILYILFMKRMETPVPYNNHIRQIKNLSEKTMLKLGWVGIEEKDSSFVNFETSKKENIVRVGCFGDSFTIGEEAAENYDYPFLLGQLFLKKGYKNVEILNFGVPGYGFHQSFIMFDEVGQKYDLDYAVFGPSGFQFERESTFSFKINNKKDKYALHSRYILEGEGLRSIEVIGDDYARRSKNYFQFIPHLQYLKYDCYASMFLSCLFPPEANLLNPFYYYKKGLLEESKQIYEKLLLTLSESKSEIVLIEYFSRITPIAKRLNKESLHHAKIFRPKQFPYQAVLGHNSPLGNAVLAQQVFDFLINSEESNVGLLKTTDSNYNDSLKLNGIEASNKINDYKKIYIEIEGKEIGVFTDIGLVKNEDRKGHCNLFENNAKSLIAFNPNKESVIDAYFLPVEFEFKNNKEAKLKIKENFNAHQHDLGQIKLLIPELAVAGFKTKNFQLEKNKDKIVLKLNKELKDKISPLREGSGFSLLIDGKIICEGRFSKEWGGIELITKKYNFKAARATEDSFLDFDSLPEKGKVNIICENSKGEKKAIEFGVYKKEYMKIKFNKQRNLFLKDEFQRVSN